jgi:hypothetical protein
MEKEFLLMSFQEGPKVLNNLPYIVTGRLNREQIRQELEPLLELKEDIAAASRLETLFDRS